MQDELGILWFGRLMVLINLMVIKWKFFAMIRIDANSMSDNIIYDILVDQDGILWIGTDNGLNSLDPVSANIHPLSK